MRSLFDNPKAMGSVNLRRLPGGSHSVVKQASFYIASGIDFRGFQKPKSMPKFDLRAFFQFAFGRFFFFDFGRILGGFGKPK